MGHADNNPDAIIGGYEYSASSFYTVLILLCILILVTVILIFVIIESRKTIKKLKEPMLPTTDKEQELINKYRKLSTQDKNVIDDTVNALTHNSIKYDYQNDGN